MPLGETASSNVYLHATIRMLKKAYREQKARIWRAIIEYLERPKRKRIAVNLSKINRYAKEGETVIVPGKVLGAGELTKKLTIAAFSFSSSALRKIKKANGQALTLQELLKINPRGSNVRIIA